MTDFTDIIKRHAERYPMSSAQDFIKLAYQAEFGCGHLICDSAEKTVFDYFESEWNTADNSRVMQPVFEEIGEDFVRLHLAAARDAGYDINDIFKLFILSARDVCGGQDGMQTRINLLSAMAAEGALPFSFFTFTQGLADWLSDGMSHPRHSEVYRQAYSPAYRVIAKKYLPALEIVGKIRESSAPLTVFIDGRCGSGKSSIARALAYLVDADVISADHFFLPSELRTEARLSEAGGNFHRERFALEVIPHLKKGEPFEYGVFDCSCGKITHTNRLSGSNVTIVEGSYSLHPDLRNAADIKVFVTAPYSDRLAHIARRDGADCLPAFETRWIPLEEAYFSSAGLPEIADIVIDNK